MEIVWDTMITEFSQIKEAGSYFLFYLLTLGLGMMVAWERYKSGKSGDNWMVEEAKKQIRLWPFLFALCALVLVVANPVSIWILNKISPIQGQFYQVWPLLMPLFLIAYGVVCFMSLLPEQKQKSILVLGFVLLIGLAGSSYGLLSVRQGEEAYSSERQIMEAVPEENREGILLAPNKVLEYAAIYEPEILLLYGKDLYTPNLDLGIMDAYDPELLSVYEAMQNQEENLELLGEMAFSYGCEIMVLDAFDQAPETIGEFTRVDGTGNYFIYVRK